MASLVTNGARLARLMDQHAGDIDWVALSVDSADEEVQARLGRGRGDHVAWSIELAEARRALGIRLKLNTVVTALTWEEDMRPLARRMRPERWKVFQVLPVVGQNEHAVADLLIREAQFQHFVRRNRSVEDHGIAFVPEANAEMTYSYVMIDPIGRFFGNTGGVHRVSAPILEVGIPAALEQLSYQPERFDARGGRYDW